MEGVLIPVAGIVIGCLLAYSCSQHTNKEYDERHARETKCQKACYPHPVTRCFDDKAMCNETVFYKKIKQPKETK